MCLAMLLPLCACGGDEPVQKQVFAMDTIMTLTAYGDNADAGLDNAAGVIQAMDTMLDPKSDSSYTSQINSAKGEDVVVPPQVAQMLSVAFDVYTKSNGALDLSVYPLYEAWGEFKEDTGRIPSDTEIENLLKQLNFGKLSITEFPGESNSSVSLPGGTQLSFGAVAKGCAANYAVDAMRKAGVESGIISLGGNVQTLGVKPDGSMWTVAVEDPNAPGTDSYVGTLRVGETAIVTSGSYQRFFTYEGQRYHHIIDKDSLQPENRYLSVTILADDSALADALSTAVFNMEIEEGRAFIENLEGIEAMWILADGSEEFSSGFGTYLQ